VENATRKVTVDELLIFAIALNTSIIDLLTPESGKPLKVAEGVEPLHPGWLEDWLRGDTPWPATSDKSVQDEFFSTASEQRRIRYRTGLRPEMQEIATLRSAVAGAIEGPGGLNEIQEPDLMADYLRTQLERVTTYLNLLADRIETQGYAAR
jgi:hypothetical protein